LTLVVAFSAVAVGATALGMSEWQRRGRPVAVVVTTEAPVRAAPYGGAGAAATVPAGAAVLLGRRYGRWVEVRRSDGVRGWVLAVQVVPL